MALAYIIGTKTLVSSVTRQHFSLHNLQHFRPLPLLSLTNTMKQKAVIKVQMNNQKGRRKAMKIAVGAPGVESAALKGEDKRLLEITGDGFDMVELTRKLRKDVGHAELVSVGKDDKKDKDAGKIVLYGCGVPSYSGYGYPYSYECYPVQDRSDSCSIL